MPTHRQPPSLQHFLRKAVRSFVFAAGVTAIALGIGIAGYGFFEGLSFLDSLLNASMILAGMGPIWSPVTNGGKLFASFYALFSGLVFLSVAALLFAPVMHTVLHHFHWEISQDPKGGSKSPPA
jgi:hypothetical protein